MYGFCHIMLIYYGMKKSYEQAKAEFHAKIAARQKEEFVVIEIPDVPALPITPVEDTGGKYRVLKHFGDIVKPVAFNLGEEFANTFIAAQPDRIVRDAAGELVKVSYSKVMEN